MDSFSAYRFRILDHRQRTLDVSGTLWDAKDLEALSNIAKYMDIKTLSLASCGLDKTKIPALLTILENMPGLEVLDLRGNAFDAHDVHFFHEVVRMCPMLVSIDVEGNDMKEVQWTEFVEMVV